MPKLTPDIRSLCRAFTNETVQIMAGIARAGATPPGVRVAAIAALWDRGWGKPPQTHTGENGDGDIRITIRHILEGSDGNGARTVDHKATPRIASHDVTTPDGGETAG